MDDDANIGTKLDDVVLPTDKFLLGKEPYDFDDRCYTPDFPLSNHSITQRFFAPTDSNPRPAVPTLFDNKFFFNWAIFANPGNPLLLRIMEHIVALLKAEYLNESKIKLSPLDHRGKLLMCATTFPITHAAREMIFENKQIEEMGLRVGGLYFKGTCIFLIKVQPYYLNVVVILPIYWMWLQITTEVGSRWQPFLSMFCILNELAH